MRSLYNGPRSLTRFSRIVLLGWLICGAMFLVSAFTGFDPSPTLAKEKLIEIVVGSLLFIGVFLVLKLSDSSSVGVEPMPAVRKH